MRRMLPYRGVDVKGVPRRARTVRAVAGPASLASGAPIVVARRACASGALRG